MGKLSFSVYNSQNPAQTEIGQPACLSLSKALDLHKLSPHIVVLIRGILDRDTRPEVVSSMF